jgi:uncharacterized protein YchJ
LGNQTKNQHYIPESLLINFANEKEQVYEALVDKNKIYQTNISQSMSQRDTYEHPNLEINYLEKEFGKIETYLAPAIREILSILESDFVNIDNIKNQVESNMKEFLIFYYRSGALLKEFSFDGLDESDKIHLMLEKIMNSKYLIELSDTIKSYYDFAVIKNEENNFILSDQYVSTSSLSIKGQYTNTSNRHIGLKDVLILIPLSSKYYVVYSNGKTPNFIESNKVNTLTQEETNEINKTIINNSYVKCIGMNKTPLEQSLTSYNYQSPTRSIMAYKSGVKTASLNKKEVFFYQDDIEQWNFFRNLKHVINKDTKRNELCKCGSGKKYKHCCLNMSERNYHIVNNMYKKNRHLEIRANLNSSIEKPLEEFSFISKADEEN